MTACSLAVHKLAKQIDYCCAVSPVSGNYFFGAMELESDGQTHRSDVIKLVKMSKWIRALFIKIALAAVRAVRGYPCYNLRRVNKYTIFGTLVRE